MDFSFEGFGSFETPTLVQIPSSSQERAASEEPDTGEEGIYDEEPESQPRSISIVSHGAIRAEDALESERQYHIAPHPPLDTIPPTAEALSDEDEEMQRARGQSQRTQVEDEAQRERNIGRRRAEPRLPQGSGMQQRERPRSVQLSDGLGPEPPTEDFTAQEPPRDQDEGQNSWASSRPPGSTPYHGIALDSTVSGHQNAYPEAEPTHNHNVPRLVQVQRPAQGVEPSRMVPLATLQAEPQQPRVQLRSSRGSTRHPEPSPYQVAPTFIPQRANSHIYTGPMQIHNSAAPVAHGTTQAPTAVSQAPVHSPRPTRLPSHLYHPARTPVSQSPAPVEGVQDSPPKPADHDQRRPRRPSRTGGGEGPSSRSQSATGQSGELCVLCKQVGPGRYLCSACGYAVFCDNCWDSWPMHTAGQVTLGSIPHEKTQTYLAKKVKDVLAPSITPEQREQRHIDDINTTWFGVVRGEEGEIALPLFRDYGQYTNLIAKSRDLRYETASTLSGTADPTETVFPSLVSFVGETGAGKSTLIKLLIDLNSNGFEEEFQTPVIGASGRDLATSEDVHLYLDPDSAGTREPLLFADCEGLEGGEREPVGARLKRQIEKKALAAGGRRHRSRLKHTSERELEWANTPWKQRREYAVANLYPRLLYTFSDVIVFVLQNKRKMEQVFQRLVEWAQAALEKSSNQPVLPHVIIALNASDNDLPKELWDVTHATERLMENLSNTVHKNEIFKRFAKFWRERDREIETVQQLLDSYYSSVHVVHIPKEGRPNLINEQIGKLSHEIRDASVHARRRKADLRMLLDADEIQPYLQEAFDHFAKSLDEPFDFVQASFSYSPIPNNFGGNILKLAIQVMECWKDLARGNTIFEEVGYVVASCIMLDAARNKNKGAVQSIFPQYLEHIDNALENFCDRHWPCEFVGPRGGRCVNVRSGHGAKGHQLKSGKLLAAGEYISNFTFETHRTKFRDDVYHKLVALRERVRQLEESGPSEEEAAAEVHKDLVLPTFLEHASRGDKQAFISHTVCFCCLFEPPEHALRCGHVLCTRCLKTYGKPLFNNKMVEIAQCPMEKSRARTPWRVTLKPANCGVRVLTLDGGGIRGIVELEILRQIEREFSGKLNVQSLFDLIVGTSTGGIIALGLTARNWTVEECTQNFEAFVLKAFKARKGMNLPGIDWLVQNYNHSKYETQPLEEALIAAFTDDQFLFGGKRSDPGSLDLKVAVTATSAAGRPIVLANYNRLCHDRLPYDFQRPEKPQAELKTWEAARATSAAPTYFKPLCHEPSKQTYADGGIHHNNPIQVADRERKLIWPSQSDDEPDIMVSIGTAFCNEAKPKRRPGWPSAAITPTTGILNHEKYLLRMFKGAASLDSERRWQEYLDIRRPRPEDRARYVRLNPELSETPPKLDDVNQMHRLQEQTRHLIADSPRIKKLARQLVAACFYFEPAGGVKEDPETEMFEVQGYIQCRFIAGFEVVGIGNFISKVATAGHPAHFLIREEGNEDALPQEVHITPNVVSKMISSQQFIMSKKICIRRSSKLSRTDISLCFTRGETFPISGYPRRLHSEPSTLATSTSRQNLAHTNSYRWAGGKTLSQHQRREDWQPPTTPTSIGDTDVIARYSDAGHLLGNATDADLMNNQATQPIPDVARSATHAARRMSPPALSSFVTSELPTTELEDERYYAAFADWRAPAEHTQYLNLRMGDIVKIISMTEEDWWFAQLPSSPQQGWVPKSILQPAGPNAPIMFRAIEQRNVFNFMAELDATPASSSRSSLRES